MYFYEKGGSIFYVMKVIQPTFAINCYMPFMIKCIRFSVLLIFVAVAGCNNATTETPQNTAATVDIKDESTPGDFYKRMSGTIAGKNVIVQLHKFGTLVQGYYQYSDADRPIKLVNWQDTIADNTYHLTEVDNDGDAQDITGAGWDITVSKDGVSGKWTSADGRTTNNISLKEDYPAGSIRLEAFHFADTARMFVTRQFPRAIVAYGGVYPSMNDKTEPGAFLRSAIANHMTLEGGAGMPRGFKTRAWRYFGNYRIDLKNLVDSNASEEVRKGIAYQYNSTFYHSVIFNDNNWLVLEDAVADYTGGAHGTYTATYQNLDISTSTSWHLDDIIKDTTMLKPLLETAVREYFKIAPSEKLDSRLLVPDMPVSTNVYLTRSGLMFVYQPYEIASYADGLIQLFLPYPQLMPVLTPKFIARQQLGGKGGVAMR